MSSKIAATLISEIGDITQFSHPKKLVAYAGIDPLIYQSGKLRIYQFDFTFSPLIIRGVCPPFSNYSLLMTPSNPIL